MKPDMIRYGVLGVISVMLIQWMTGKFDENQTKMLINQDMIINTLEHSNYVQEAMLREMETGNDLNRRRIGIRIDE